MGLPRVTQRLRPMKKNPLLVVRAPTVVHHRIADRAGRKSLIAAPTEVQDAARNLNAVRTGALAPIAEQSLIAVQVRLTVAPAVLARVPFADRARAPSLIVVRSQPSVNATTGVALRADHAVEKGKIKGSVASKKKASLAVNAEQPPAISIA